MGNRERLESNFYFDFETKFFGTFQSNFTLIWLCRIVFNKLLKEYIPDLQVKWPNDLILPYFW